MFQFFEKVNKGQLKISTIKNAKISLYCHLNIIIKESGTCFQFPALRQKHDRNVSQTAH